MKVNIFTNSYDKKEFATIDVRVEALPRIGDTLKLNSFTLIVQDIVWNYKGLYLVDVIIIAGFRKYSYTDESEGN